MFFDKFGSKPVPYGQIDGLEFSEIIKNKRVERFFSKNSITATDYRKSHLDCFAFIKIDNSVYSMVVDVWGPQHKSMGLYRKIFPKRNKNEYKRMKAYDKLRNILWDEGFLDIFIVLPLYKLTNNKYQGYIIKEFKRQLSEIHFVNFSRNFTNYSWISLMKDIRFAKDYQDLTGYL